LAWGTVTLARAAGRSAAGSAFSSVFDAAGSAVSSAFDAAGSGFSSVFDAAGSGFSSAFAGAGSAFDAAGSGSGWMPAGGALPPGGAQASAKSDHDDCAGGSGVRDSPAR
jgi:hypothetical protein